MLQVDQLLVFGWMADLNDFVGAFLLILRPNRWWHRDLLYCELFAFQYERIVHWITFSSASLINRFTTERSQGRFVTAKVPHCYQQWLTLGPNKGEYWIRCYFSNFRRFFEQWNRNVWCNYGRCFSNALQKSGCFVTRGSRSRIPRVFLNLTSTRRRPIRR